MSCLGAAPWLPAPVLMAGWLGALLWHCPLAYCSRDGSACTVWMPAHLSPGLPAAPGPGAAAGAADGEVVTQRHRAGGAHAARRVLVPGHRCQAGATTKLVMCWCYPLSTRQCLVLVLAPTLSSRHPELQSPASHPLHRAACRETGGEVRSSLLWPVTCTGTHAPSLHQWVPSPPQLVPSSGGPSKHNNHPPKC